MSDQNSAASQPTNKLLIIEDEQALSSLLADKFRADGFEVMLASDGQEGLKLALDWKPDIILLDIIMPKMDGMTMLHKLREHEDGKKVQVILLTNLSDTDKVYDAMSHGVFDYLVKSNWEIDDLVREVRAKMALPK